MAIEGSLIDDDFIAYLRPEGVQNAEKQAPSPVGRTCKE